MSDVYPGETGEKTLSTIITSEEIRKTLAIPSRHLSRSVREDIAEILCQELIFAKHYEIKDYPKFLAKYGLFDEILRSLKSTAEWQSLLTLCKKSDIIAKACLNRVLSDILRLMDQIADSDKSLLDKIPEDLRSVLEKFDENLEELIKLWGRNLPSTTLDSLKETEPPEHFEVIEQLSEAVDCSVTTNISGGLSDFIKDMEKHADVLELLSLLYPGRLWDLSIVNLHKQYFENLDRYSKIVEKSAEIRRIIELLGRVELEAGSRRIAISHHGKTEVYSVTTSNSLEYVLPAELALLSDEAFELLFYSKYVESKLLTYQLRGKYWTGGPPRKKRKGPVIALVDTSGSMHGTPELMAKAIILGVARKMLKEERNVKVTLFSSTGQTEEIDLTSKERMAKAFLDFLNYSFGGGTDFNTALASGLKSLKEQQFKGADLLFITDGLSDISDTKLMADWNSFKAENDTRVFSFIIGNNHAGGLSEVSDHVFIAGKNNNWDIEDGPSNMLKMMAN